MSELMGVMRESRVGDADLVTNVNQTPLYWHDLVAANVLKTADSYSNVNII